MISKISKILEFNYAEKLKTNIMLKKTYLFLVSPIFLFLLLTGHNFISNSSSLIPIWSSSTNIPISVRAGNTASYSKDGNGWLIIVSGRDQNDLVTKKTQRFNVNTSQWDTLAPHPTGLLGSATAIVGDSLYIIGGVINPPGFGTQTVYKLDINQNVWSTLPNCPIDIVDAKGVSYQDSIIYIAGGFSGSVGGGLVYMFNVKSKTWKPATPFTNFGRRNFGGFAITGDTLVYMCGTTQFGSGQFFDSVYVGVINQSDRSQISWRQGARFPGQTRTFFDAHSWGNKGIIMSGGSTDNSFSFPSDECYSYSPGSDIWTQLPNKPTAWTTGQSGSVKLNNGVLKLICASGYNAVYLNSVQILTDTMTSVNINIVSNEVPETFKLNQNYPNPFNPETNIEFSIKKSDLTTLKVFDTLGNEISILINQVLSPGIYKLKFNGRNFSSGIYFYTLENNGFKETKRMILIK